MGPWDVLRIGGGRAGWRRGGRAQPPPQLWGSSSPSPSETPNPLQLPGGHRGEDPPVPAHPEDRVSSFPWGRGCSVPCMELWFWDRGTALPALSVPQAGGGAQGKAWGARHGGSRGRARQRRASSDSAVSHPAPRERSCSCKHRPGQSHQAKRGRREDPENGTGIPSSLPCLHPLPRSPLPLEEFAFFPSKHSLLWRLSTTRSLPEPG